jgi:hypothetical protein
MARLKPCPINEKRNSLRSDGKQKNYATQK